MGNGRTGGNPGAPNVVVINGREGLKHSNVPKAGGREAGEPKWIGGWVSRDE